MSDKMIIQASRSGFTGFQRIELSGGIQHQSGKISALQPVEVKGIETGMFVAPFMTLDADTAQMLMDELYLLGVRPSQPQEVANGDLKAHIADLRKIAFKQLGIKS